MDDISLRKRQLDDKLAQEKNILAFLKDSLEKTDQITGNMLDILSKFEVRIHKLEDTIVPVHRETDDLQRRQANIDKCLSALDHVISYHHVSASVEHVIRDSPTGQLEAYIKNLERVLDAIEFFNHNNPNCMELSSLTALRDYGRDSLEKEFRLMLNRHSKPVPVEMIVELVESETENSKENVKLEHLSEKVLEDLCTITHWLNGPGYDETVDFMSVYAQIRSNSLVRSLQGLKDCYGSKMKSAPGGITTPTRKGTAKRREGLRRVPSKSEHHGLPRRTSAIPTEVGASKEEEEEIDAANYIVFCKSLLRLIQSERELMKSIIPEQSQSTTFDTLIQAAMEDFIAEGESIISILKRHFGKHNYSAIQQVFPILKEFNAIQPDFYVTLQETFHRTQKQFPTLIHELESLSAKALDDFKEGIKQNPDKHSNMPSDGTVHELTRNTLIFMEQLLPYTETVGSMLVTMQEDQSGNFFTREKELFVKVVSEYIQRVLGALGLNLELKATVYEAPTLSSLFLLNNYNYIVKALQRSGLLTLLQEGGITGVEDQYQQLIAEHKETYQKCWNKVLTVLMEVEKPMSGHKGNDPQAKLKDKQRQMIKDKFKGFNTEFEELYQIQKTYAVPDTQLRDQLRGENVNLILPLYSSFRQKFANLPFTKNPEKYIKYSVEAVEVMMKKFFDVSA
ncbi:exocyst complex component 7-like [Pocillopora damicornis]|uniref:exocyst complex component 7-like n=1 Tax=Pocillopora damicornis TaxID=46731 RepID=UPI000F54C9C5|nr:exocyst complex component 7-like [Pocillopora damicornis]